MTHLYDRDELAQLMSDLARSLAGPASLDDVLRGATASAVELIPGADCADVLMIEGGRKFESFAATSEIPGQLDAVQQRLAEGPCLEAAVDSLIIRSDDLRAETRWPRYASAAVDAGVYGTLAFKLYTGHETAGALNVFALQANVFTSESESVGSVLAAHAAVAILASRKDLQFKSALATRDIIGQAKGMIMERYDVDAVRAFEMLTRLSQDTNTPLAELALQLVSRKSP